MVLRTATGTFFLIVLIFGTIEPALASTDIDCSGEGYTVVYVNGIFTNKDKAKQDKDSLNKRYRDRYPLSDNVKFILGHNPSHIAGAGDLLQTVSQSLMQPSNTFDRDTILMDIHDKINTQKIYCLFL